MSKTIKLSLFAAVIAVVVCGPVWAHNVAVFAWVEGDTVHVEGKFGSGRKPVNAPVEVYDPQQNLLLSGVTDENGEFSFKVPGKTEMKVVLLAGMGHRGEWKIPLSDLEAFSPGEAGEVDVSGSGQTVSPGPEPAMGIVAAADSLPAATGFVTAAEMREAVEAALDKKLKPMMKLLIDAKQSGPSMTDILGGIGYIFGLVGMAAYAASRRRKT